LGLNRQLRQAIEAGLRGEHQAEVEALGRRLPNFIVIGAAKSATTTLTTILPRHPDFFISRRKEPKFFGRRYDKGWAWCGRLFKAGRHCKLRGEGSTMYASALHSFAQAPALMRRYLPNLKLEYVCSTRRSAWNHSSDIAKGANWYPALPGQNHCADNSSSLCNPMPRHCSRTWKTSQYLDMVNTHI
jgi:hypothetical protein